MRFGKTILGSFLLWAAILLPSVSFAHESRSPGAVAVAVENAVVVENHVDAVVTSIDDSISMDCGDCCPQHGSKRAPCSSSACCVGHCVGVLSIFQPTSLLLSGSVITVCSTRDQVLTSSAVAPPFRPPRA